MLKKLKNYKLNLLNLLIIVKVYNLNKVKFIKQYWIAKSSLVKGVNNIKNNNNNHHQIVVINLYKKHPKTIKKKNQLNNLKNP